MNSKLVAPQALQDTIDTPSSFASYYKTTSQSVRNWVNDGRIPVIFRTEKVIRFWRGEALAALNASGKDGRK
jgi:hypothetical protein